GRAWAMAGLGISLVVVAVPVGLMRMARGLPGIHDISTDTDDPPQLEAVLPLRAGVANPATYGGPDIAAQQHRAFPEVVPLVVGAPPAQAFGRALKAAHDMGWVIVASDP